MSLSLLETVMFVSNWGPATPRAAAAGWRRALVYVTGVSDYARPSLRDEQLRLLQGIAAGLEVDLCVDHLIGARPLRTFPPNILLSSLRNFWQAFLAINFPAFVGPRLAAHIAARVGMPAAGATLVLVCQSAGASLALAAAEELKRELGVKLVLLSFGGVFGGSIGFDQVDRFFHFEGDHDTWSRAAERTLPSRRRSPALRRARREGRFLSRSSGPHWHYGPGGYMGKDVDRTIAAMTCDEVRGCLT